MTNKIPTYNEIMAMFAQSAKSLAEFRREFTKSLADHRREFNESLADYRQEFNESLVKMSEELSEKMESIANKEAARRAKSDAEFDLRMEKLTGVVNGIGSSNGKVSMDLVFGRLNRIKKFGGITFSEVRREVKKQGKDKTGSALSGEYDVLLFNGSSAAIIDVKYRVRSQDIDYLIDTQLPKFKLLFNKCKKFKIYLGLGGMAFETGVVRKAKQKGIGIIKMDEGITKIEDKNVVAWS